MKPMERFTDRANKVMELALREALSLGHSYVGTEHVLLGLVREGEGVAAQVLVMDLGLDLGLVRKAVIERLSGYQSEETKMRNAIRRRGIDIGNQVTGDELRKIAVVLGWTPEDTDPIAERLERIPSHTSPTTDGFTFVQIDRVPYRVKVGDYTGAQIRRFAAPPIADDRDLWMQEPFGENDLLIRDDDTVALGPTTGTRMWTHPRFINGG